MSSFIFLHKRSTKKTMSLTLNKRIDAFSELGEILRSYSDNNRIDRYEKYYRILDRRKKTAEEENPWFTEKNIMQALKNTGFTLETQKISEWINSYSEFKKQDKEPRIIGVVNAGNIPLVGFHDFLCVLISGNIYYGKLSSKDKELPGAVSEILIDLEPELENYIRFESENLKNFDGIIATGSDNTSRYFEYYFGKYPHIIRKNRNSAAVLTGNESGEELKKLAEDIFLYFGLGCRNVSKIFIPQGYQFNSFFENIQHYEEELKQHNKYSNNYDYNRTIFLMNKTPHLDNGFLLLKEDTGFGSPIATLFYETYTSIKTVKESLNAQKENIQCIVSSHNQIKEAISFGESQKPGLSDYADNIDTVQFILSLNN